MISDILHTVCVVPKQRHAYLQQAVQLIKSCMDKSDGGTDGSKACTGEIMILCAEVACQVCVILLSYLLSHTDQFFRKY